MSESYIGLAPSYGVFEKQVIAGTTATSYALDFDVVQATQLMVSLDGIVQEPDYSYSVGRDENGKMKLTFASALTEQTASSVTLTSGSTTISAVSNTGLYNVGQPVTGNANIPANTFILQFQVHPHSQFQMQPQDRDLQTRQSKLVLVYLSHTLENNY